MTKYGSNAGLLPAFKGASLGEAEAAAAGGSQEEEQEADQSRALSTARKARRRPQTALRSLLPAEETVQVSAFRALRHGSSELPLWTFQIHQHAANAC